MSIIALSAALLLLQGCPQSPTDPGSGAATSAGSDADASAESGGAPTEVDGAPTEVDGAASADAAGGAEGPPPASSPGAPPGDVGFDLDGDVVTLSGSVVYSGDKDGEIRLDFLTLEENRPPQLIHTASLDGPGDFSIPATASFGEVYVVGFVDQAGDGPSPEDPAGMVQIEIAAAEVSGVTLTLSDDPDLGPLTPGEGVKEEAMEIPEEVPPPPADGAEGTAGAEGEETPE